MISVKICFGILIIVACLFYILYIDTVSLFLLLFLIFLPIASGIIFHASKKKVRFSLRTESNSVGKENAFNLYLFAENPTSIPFSHFDVQIKCTNTLSNESEIFRIKSFCAPNNSQKISVKLSSSYCGYIACEIVKISIYDVLMMFSHKIKGSKLDNNQYRVGVTIMPTLTEISDSNGFCEIEAYDSDVMSKIKKGDDPSEIFDTHKYISGDRLNRIHWKMSARLDELFVKDFSMPTSNSYYLIFDLDNTSKTDDEKYFKDLDTCLEGLFSFSFSLVQSEISHKIVYFNKSLGSYDVTEITDTDECYDGIRTVIKELGESQKIAQEFILNELEHKKGQIMYFTPHIHKDMLDFLEAYCENLKTTIVTLGEKAEAHLSENSGLQIIKVISGEFSESLNQLYL